LGQETLSCDPDAAWIKKGNKSYFGYKGFAVAGGEDGYVKNVHVTAANISEVREFANIGPRIKSAKHIYCDKGYSSQNNTQLIKGLGFKNSLMEKAQRNKPLRRNQFLFNRLISRTRYKVAQLFGTLKRRFCFIHEVV
jgi:IS5 family transposase